MMASQGDDGGVWGGGNRVVRLWGGRRVRAGTARAMLGLLVGMASSRDW